MFAELPATAAWRHLNSRVGFEAASFARQADGWLAVGSTTAFENGVGWWVAYEIELSASFVTRRARVQARVGTAALQTVVLAGDGLGSWTIDDRPAPELAGCLDVDLESSALTNTWPLRRLGLMVGAAASAPAAYVRTPGLAVERLEQHYAHAADAVNGSSYEYRAPAFDFSCLLSYDSAGLVMDYPRIARRVG